MCHSYLVRSRLHRRFVFQDTDELFAQVAVISSTMDRAQRFSAVSGKAMLVIGCSAVLTSLVARSATTSRAWLALWISECALAVAISLYSMSRKLGGWQELLNSPSCKRCALVLLPTAVSGLVTTLLALRLGWIALTAPTPDWLPGLWLLFYGAAVFAGGIVSLVEIRWLGVALFSSGLLSSFLDWSAFATTIVGFGILHIIFGVILWQRHES